LTRIASYFANPGVVVQDAGAKTLASLTWTAHAFGFLLVAAGLAAWAGLAGAALTSTGLATATLAASASLAAATRAAFFSLTYWLSSFSYFSTLALEAL